MAAPEQESSLPPQDSFMNESFENQNGAEPYQQPDNVANGSTRLDTEGTGGDRSSLLYQSKEEKSQAMKKIKSQREAKQAALANRGMRELSEELQNKNRINVKDLDNMVYTDLFSEKTVSSPNYKPPKNAQQRKQISFNSPHNFGAGGIKKFIFPKAEDTKKISLSSHAKKLSFIQRYKQENGESKEHK